MTREKRNELSKLLDQLCLKVHKRINKTLNERCNNKRITKAADVRIGDICRTAHGTYMKTRAGWYMI